VVHGHWVVDGITSLPKHGDWEVIRDLLISDNSTSWVVVPSSVALCAHFIVFEVDVGSSDLGLNEWHVVGVDIPDLVHDTLWIKDQLNFSLLVQNWWVDVLENWSQVSLIDQSAIV
jgi:hypothetical protein